MARKSKHDAQLAAQAAEIAQLRSLVAQQAIAGQRSGAPTRASELYVGIRNVSDMTIGIKSPFPNEPDLQLFAAFGQEHPSETAVISYAWYLQLRRGPHMAKGMIVRDDTILGGHYAPAPADRPEDIPPEAAQNLILDPVAWVESKTESELRDAVAKITAVEQLYRLRRVVDERLRQIQAKYPLEDNDRAIKAQRELPALYVMLDQLVNQRLDYNTV